MQQDLSARARILSAARAEFLAKRFSEVSLRQICRNAGITTGGFYRYFKDKEDVFAALVAPVVEKVDELILTPDEEGTADAHRVLSARFLGDRFVHCVQSMHEDEEILQLFLQNSNGTRFEHYERKAGDVYARQLYRTYQALHESGEGRGIDEEQILFFGRCFIDILGKLLNAYKDPEQAERMIRGAVRFWAAGFSELTGIPLE